MSKYDKRYFGVILSLATAMLTGCATISNSNFPTYPYQGIDLLAGVTGTVVYSGGCYKMASTSPPNAEFALIFPNGTKISDQHIDLPAANGGNRIFLNDLISAQGGFNDLEEGSFINNPTSCQGRAFLVNRMSNDNE